MKRIIFAVLPFLLGVFVLGFSWHCVTTKATIKEVLNKQAEVPPYEGECSLALQVTKQYLLDNQQEVLAKHGEGSVKFLFSKNHKCLSKYEVVLGVSMYVSYWEERIKQKVCGEVQYKVLGTLGKTFDLDVFDLVPKQFGLCPDDFDEQLKRLTEEQ